MFALSFSVNLNIAVVIRSNIATNDFDLIQLRLHRLYLV